MSILRKIFIWLLGAVAFLLLLDIGLSIYISKKLPSLLQSNADIPYTISYEDLDISLITGSFTVHNLYLSPKDSIENQLKQGAYGKIKTVDVRHFNIWALLADNHIKVKKVILDEPDISLFYRKDKYSSNDDVKPFKEVISTKSLEIHKGKFRMLDSLKHYIARAANINFTLNSITVDSSTVKKDVPVRYRDYTLKCDSLFYQAGPMYHVVADNLNTTDNSLSIKNFKLVPELSRIAFARSIPKEKDQYRISAKTIEIPKADWGFFNDTLYVHTPSVILDNVNAVVYRPKMPADDTTTKKLYSQMLRELDFDLKIDELRLKDAFVEYEEQQEYDREPAVVNFSKFNATVNNIYSPVNKGRLPLTTIDVHCLFMRSAPMSIGWSFNAADVSDSFTIKGRLANVESDRLNPVSKPLMNFTSEGILKQIVFTFNGNREKGAGEFAIKYDNFKVQVYKNKGKDKNHFLSFIGNLLAKNDSNGAVTETKVSVDRDKTKSAFNFLWKFLQGGLKDTILKV